MFNVAVAAVLVTAAVVTAAVVTAAPGGSPRSVDATAAVAIPAGSADVVTAAIV